MNLPRYAKPEWERRFLVNAADLAEIPEVDERRICDRYLDGGRLRLRKIEEDGIETVFKLSKKYGGEDPLGEPITNLYLSEAEYQALRSLPGRDIAKRRTRVMEGGTVFGIDRFEGKLAGLILAEFEAETRESLLQVAVPGWAEREVTLDPFYRGGHLCGIEASELAERLLRR